MGIDDTSSSPRSVFRSCRRRYMPSLLGVRLFREPDAGNPPVRFDEREQETEPRQTGLRRRCAKAPSTTTGRLKPLRLFSTLLIMTGSRINRLTPTPMLMYRSGEEIRKGDHVRFHGNLAEIELVATDPSDSEQAWHVKEFGGGVLIADPMVSGRTFIPKDQLAEYEDLEFVSRAR